MARVAIDELVTACRTDAPRPKKDTTHEGGLVWLRGIPTSAPEGSVALRLADGAIVLILAKDVVQVERDDDNGFGVALRIDTSVIMARTSVRLAFEAVPDKAGSCGCSQPTSLARPLGGSLGGGIRHCNALENFCMGSGGGLNLFGGDVTVEDMQDHLLQGAKCRDLWFGCIARVFDSNFGP